MSHNNPIFLACNIENSTLPYHMFFHSLLNYCTLFLFPSSLLYHFIYLYRILSNNPLPLMITDCVVTIMLRSRFFSILDNTLDMILYMHSTKDIGLYSSRLIRLSFLGISTINYVLQPLGMGSSENHQLLVIKIYND